MQESIREVDLYGFNEGNKAQKRQYTKHEADYKSNEACIYRKAAKSKTEG